MRLQNPARCPECSEEIDTHPASRRDGKWEGYCPTHGVVVAASEIATENVVDEDKMTITPSEFCHIVDTEQKNFCGYTGDLGRITCKPYNGEAICGSCGRTNCPTCVTMASLNDRLEDM